MRDGEVAARGEWEIPEGVVIAPDVDLTALDPAALLDSARRRCIAQTKAGGRCRVNAVTSRALCAAHSGLLDSRAGGLAKAAKINGQKADAEERMVASRLGARAVIRQAVLDDHEKLTQTVQELLASSAAGDRKAQALLATYLTQGFGTPNVPAGDDSPPDGEGFDLGQLTTDELRKLAHGQTT